MTFPGKQDTITKLLSNKAMERWLSWSKAHDWKSCNVLKAFKGSNPFLSAKKEDMTFGHVFLFYLFVPRPGLTRGYAPRGRRNDRIAPMPAMPATRHQKTSCFLFWNVAAKMPQESTSRRMAMMPG